MQIIRYFIKQLTLINHKKSNVFITLFVSRGIEIAWFLMVKFNILLGFQFIV